MPICRPEYPNFQSNGEKIVWNILKDVLPNNSTIFQNQKLNLYGKTLEIDTFVVLPGHGMVCIEVKGGKVDFLADGFVQTYYQGTAEKVNPGNQCSEYTSALKNQVKNIPALQNPRIAWLAIFPETEITDDSMRRSRYLDKNDLHRLKEEIIKVAEETDNNRKTNSIYAKDFIHEIFGEDKGIKGWIEDQRSREIFRNQKTIDRSEILEMTDARQFRFQGPPGCGKTQLALLQARRLEKAGNQIALISYSEAVARYFQKEVANWPDGERPKYVGTFYGLLHYWGLKEPELGTKAARNHWYKSGAAAEMLEHLQVRTSAAKFDGFVVDEGQDFEKSWWDVIREARNDRHDVDYLCVFGDKNENLFERSDLNSQALFELKINRTIRQSAPIAEFYKKVTGSDSKVTGLGGPPVTVIEIDPDLSMARATLEIDRLIQDGWDPADILVINTAHQLEEQIQLRESVKNNKSKFWDKFFDKEGTFFCHVLSAKGIESPVVIVVFDGWQSEAKKQQLTNAAISRATDQLIIIGDCSTVENARILWQTPDEISKSTDN